MSTGQALTDRLVVATEEQDVLYVLHWIDEMKRQKCLEDAINKKRSWKGYSAIGSIILSPFTPLRKIILEILLLEGADHESDNVLELFEVHENSDVMDLLLNWDSGGREKARDAVRLIVLPLEKAAGWIGSNLPSPPNFESRTRNGPLPARLPTPPTPSTPPTPPLEQIQQRPPSPVVKPQPQQEDSAATIEVNDLKHNEIDCEEGEILLSTKQPVHTEDSLWPQLQLPHSPVFFSMENPTTLEEIHSPPITSTSTSSEPIVQAPARLGPSVLSNTTSLPLETAPPSQLQNCANFPHPLPVPSNPAPSHPPRSPGGSHTLLIVNLPLYGTPESLSFLSNIPFFVETFPLPDRNQTVGFVQVDSAAEASTLKKDWNGYTVNSAKVKVVHGPNGLKGKEAVDYHFKNEDEIARAFTRDTGKRRRFV